jgi:hypothetical protein
VAIGGEHAVKFGKDCGPGLIGEIIEPLTEAGLSSLKAVGEVGDDQIDAPVGQGGEELVGIGFIDVNESPL